MKKLPEVKGVGPMMTMLKVFRGCIVSKKIPEIQSPCHRILIGIIEANKHIKDKKKPTPKGDL